MSNLDCLSAHVGNLRRRAFTLIEMIAVLAVIAVMAAVVLPNLLKQLDRIASDRETAALKSIGDAFQASVLRNHYIPTYTNWAPLIAAELGLSLPDMTNNVRNRPRYCLVDPNLQVGAGGGLPYRQPPTGSALPVSPRLIILSSVGDPLPNMISGTPASADFNAIWNWSDGTSTPPAGSLFNGFTRGGDLKVQRVNLSSSFVHLILTIYPTITLLNPGGSYSIDPTSSAVIPVPPTNGLDAYFLQNTRLRLSAGTSNIVDSEQLLIQDNSFVYDMGIWRGSISSIPPLAGILDFASLIPSFIAAPHNLLSTVNDQRLIVTSMQVYMDAYSAWANTPTPFSDETLRLAAVAAQRVMMSYVIALYTPNPAQ